MPLTSDYEECNRDTIWTSADERKTKIRDLSDLHLTKIVNWILDRPYQYSIGNNILDVMKDEIKIRKLEVKWEKERVYLIENSVTSSPP